MKKQEHDAIISYLPKNGWLGKYLKFSNGLETCPRFRFFAACCVMGAAINNKIWIQRGDEGLIPRLFPNPWIILIAPPNRGHKTSTINMAVNALTAAYDDVRILADKLTPETVVQALSAPRNPKEIIRIGPRDATGLIKAPEMSVFFGKQQYNVGLVSLITDLYDFRETWTSETIGRGKQTLRNNCISVFAGSTPKWLQTMIPQDAFSGGFMRRFIIVELPVGYYKRDADPKKPKDLQWKDVVDHFRVFAEMKGKMEWSKEGKEVYNEYYESFEPTGDEQYDAYREGESEHILRIAMLLELNKESMSMSADSMEQARDLLKSIETETYTRIQSLTTHPRMQTVQDIRNILKVSGIMTEGALLERIYKTLSQGERQFYEAINILRSTGMIEPIGKPGHYSYKLREE